MSHILVCQNQLNRGAKTQLSQYMILQAPTLILGACTLLLISLLSGEINVAWLTVNGFTLYLKFRLDYLSEVMLFVVGTIGMIVYRYASRYLLSDTSRKRFLTQVILTLFSVMFFTVSDNLLTAFVGWQLIGLNLYILLNHYHYQSTANRAAKKKFVINRMGDMCFLLAIILCFQKFGSTDYDVIRQNISFNSDTSLILGLLFVAVMTKSAQFPFHIWLPDTMQSPTPVSALMHAGVINSGGILLARLSPIINQTAGISYLIVTIGIFTLTAGSFFKLTQTDVKRKLAYSTMSQMGYMVLQCGIGCYAAAIFHLIAHGFYKAFLFLNAGNALQEASIIKSNTMISTKIAIFAACVTILLLGITHQVIDVQSIPVLIWTFIGISIHCFLANLINQSEFVYYKLLLIMACQILLIGYTFALTQFELISGLETQQNLSDSLQYVLMAFFIVSYVISIQLPMKKIQSNQLATKIYHCFKMKLYIEPFYRRCFLTPLRSAGESLNYLAEKNWIARIGFFAASIIPIVIVMKSPVADVNVTNISFLLLLSTIAILLMANRAKSIKKMLCYLLVAQFNLIVLNLANAETSKQLTSFTPFIPYVSLFVGIALLFAKSDVEIHQHTDNKLTVWGTYLAVLLFLLIGLPGTFSFCLLFDLIAKSTTSVLQLVMILFANIMISIVVLHLLQDYVFNLKQLSTISKKVSLKSHILLLTIIGVNLLFGNFNRFL